jgi:hypothetical protein
VSRLESRDNWVSLGTDDRARLDPNAVLTGVPLDAQFLVEGAAAVYEPTTAQPVGRLFAPARTTRQMEGKEGTIWPMSAGEAVGPAVLLNKLGQGSVVSFTVSPDQATSSEHPTIEARKLLAAGVWHLRPEPRISFDLPASVEAVVTDDPEHRLLRVFLIGYAATPQATPPRNRPYVIPGPIETPAAFFGRVNVRAAGEIRALGPLITVKSVEETAHDVLVLDGFGVLKIPY